MYEYEFPKADVTADVVVFTIHGMMLKVLLGRRRDDPFKGSWAIPGGFLDPGKESIDEAAARELLEETNLGADRLYLEQLYTFGAPDRDPRGHVVSISYYALVSPELVHTVRPNDDLKELKWWTVPDVIGETGRVLLAFDHDEIIRVAVERIRGKIDYEPKIATHLLPSEFTQAEFRHVHEVVKGMKYDPSNFNKRFRRMIADGRVSKTGGNRATGGRWATLYKIE